MPTSLLHQHEGKTEIILFDRDTKESLLLSPPGALVVEPQEATLLGFPIGEVSATSSNLSEKLMP